MDPIHQFEIKNFFPIARIGGVEIAFTNSALFMLIGLSLILFLMLGATRSRALVPGRLQSVAEMSYEFVASTLRTTAGTEGMKFFPLVFSLFMFILVLNVIGIIPYTFTVTSHIIITVALALLVFFTVVIYGFWKHGLHFFKLWVPSGVPIYIMPLVTFIEVLSFLSRPVSHSVRLFAEHACRSHHAQSIRWFRDDAGRTRLSRLARGSRATRPHGRPYGAGTAGRFPAGLRLRHPHLHLSQ